MFLMNYLNLSKIDWFIPKPIVFRCLLENGRCSFVDSSSSDLLPRITVTCAFGLAGQVSGKSVHWTGQGVHFDQNASTKVLKDKGKV